MEINSGEREDRTLAGQKLNLLRRDQPSNRILTARFETAAISVIQREFAGKLGETATENED